MPFFNTLVCDNFKVKASHVFLRKIPQKTVVSSQSQCYNVENQSLIHKKYCQKCSQIFFQQIYF